MSAPGHAILEILWGPLAGRKRILAPGQSLRVGRTDRADLTIAQDSQVSAEHFVLSWDGARCHLRDLDSARGTWLGGERIREAEVANGGWIRAGDTHFRLYFEACTPPRGDDSEALAAFAAEKDAVLAALRREEIPLFAVVDA